MTGPEKRKAIYLLHKEGMGIRALARQLDISRNTIRDIIRLEGALPPPTRKGAVALDPELLTRLNTECEGWKQRVMERLKDEEEIEVKYSTLTRLMRKLGIGVPQDLRCDRVPDEPGAEMQHDTSPYTVKLGDAPTRVVASLLYLRYSKRRYLKFYRAFNRFMMKCFLHEALMLWLYVAPVCIIDNTNLARLRGTGKDAVIVPEMAAFAAEHGFAFVCHELGHVDRKAGEERGFYTVETNFFPGRTFCDMDDLNRQAFEWATDRMYHRPVGKARLVPAKAFEYEQAFLIKLLPHLPAPYLILDRGTDQYGYASVEGNFYWVPGTSRAPVTILRYSDRLEMYRDRERLAEYRLAADGVKGALFSPEGFPKPRHRPRSQRNRTAEEEKRLRALGSVVGAYLDFVLKPKGIQRHQFLRDLFALMRQMTAPLFVKAVERAHTYGVDDVATIGRIAFLYVQGGAEVVPAVDVDESYRERDSYLEGRFTDAPDFSRYSKLLEDDDG